MATTTTDDVRGSMTWITVSTMSAAFMAVLDISITNVVLVDIRGGLGIPLDQISWVTTSYAMANVTSLPMSGWMQRRFGLKRYFIAAVLLFTFASALCAISWNLESLVLFRALQGLSGGTLSPAAHNIMFSRYPREKHGMAAAFVSGSTATGPFLAPLIGGWLADVGDWHWVFLINVPFGLLSAYLAWAHIEQPNFVKPRTPVDLFGMGLLAVGMSSGVYVLEEGNRAGWADSPLILFLGVVSVISVVTLVVRVLEVVDPIIDLRALGDRRFAAAVALYFILGAAATGASFLFSLFCGVVLNYAPIDIGLVSLRACWNQVLIVALLAPLVRRCDARLIVAVGMVALFASMVMSTQLNALIDSSALVPPLFVRAAGVSMAYLALNVIALSHLDVRRRTNAASLTNLGRTLGGSLAVALLGTQIANGVQVETAALSPHLYAGNPVLAEHRSALMSRVSRDAWNTDAAVYELLDRRMSHEALTRTFNSLFFEAAVVILACFVLVFMLRDNRADRGSRP